MPNQTTTGKSFEYAIVLAVEDFCKKNNVSLHIEKNSSLVIAEEAFKKMTEQEELRRVATAGIKHLSLLEPKLFFENDKSLLSVIMQPDSVGRKGDVRDIILLRQRDWTIGISSKNNHFAVKHSRLSQTIDFGKEWLGLGVSNNYKNSIKPYFEELQELRNKKILWRDIENKATRFYKPILHSFLNEIKELQSKNKDEVPQKLLQYMIGKEDFYKIIKEKKGAVVQAYNFNQTLNQAARQKKPDIIISKTKWPSKIINIDYKDDSENTIHLFFDEGWQISCRIHNASSRVEPSLKFDIQIVGLPQNLYKHNCY